MNALKKLLLQELSTRYDSEEQMVRALAKMEKHATSEALQQHIGSHFVETQDHLKKIDKIFKSFGERTVLQRCEATIGLLKEAEELVNPRKGSGSVNAAIICALQKIEHFEMASYGCLHEWALVLENKDAAVLLLEILVEEENANEGLVVLARASANNEAFINSPNDGPKITHFESNKNAYVA